MALTFTAYQPIMSDAYVTGSDFSTSSCLPSFTTAASSPKVGPSSTRLSFAPVFLSNLLSSSGGSLPVFSAIVFSNTV